MLSTSVTEEKEDHRIVREKIVHIDNRCKGTSFMLSVLLNWCYIFFITQLIGLGFYRCVGHVVLHQSINHSISRNTVCGMVITTIFAQFFSLFYKVGLVANLILLVLCILIIFQSKKILSEYTQSIKRTAFTWEGVLYIGVILILAFATSRGLFHTDTNIYHAQAIHWYEEMGVVKGQGNLQLHFAYNSSALAFAALFSLGFLGVQSFHCTTGFIAVLFCVWAIRHIREYSSHDSHVTDMCCVAILFYALVNLTGFMSPASDYATMFFALYLIARWSWEIESGEKDITAHALLSVLAVFLCTLKLSAGPIVLLAIYPAVCLIQEKRYREIMLYLSMGIITLMPFLIRNVIISGWLLYPFPAIDLFRVDWKIPEASVLIDSAQIKVWGKCLYDIALSDLPMKEWIPIWWSAQERYAQMLIYCNILAICLDIVMLLHHLLKKEKLNFNLILLNVVVAGCSAAWFVLAPFIRYGLSFLLATPMLAVGMWLHKKERSLYQLVSGGIIVLMFFMGSSYWEHYFTDDMVFLKHNLTEPYYIMQKDYDSTDLQEIDMDGITIYAPTHGEVSGYYNFPTTTYPQALPDVELRGDSLKDGFRNKYQ